MDRLFGLGLGVLRGLFLACALLLMLGMTSIPRTRAWHESAGVATLVPVAKWMRGWMPPWMAQRVDLEGRGTSLQAQVQAETERLKRALPERIAAGVVGRRVARGNAGSTAATLPKFSRSRCRKKQHRGPIQNWLPPDPPPQGNAPDDRQVL